MISSDMTSLQYTYRTVTENQKEKFQRILDCILRSFEFYLVC